jgi:hypothetical protein
MSNFQSSMSKAPRYQVGFFSELRTGGFQTRPYELLTGNHK